MPKELEWTTDRFRKLAKDNPNDPFYSEYAERFSHIVKLFSNIPSDLVEKDIREKYFYCIDCEAELSSLDNPTNCSICKSSNILRILIH